MFPDQVLAARTETQARTRMAEAELAAADLALPTLAVQVDQFVDAAILMREPDLAEGDAVVED
jgi:hypothetical protein